MKRVLGFLVAGAALVLMAAPLLAEPPARSDEAPRRSLSGLPGTGLRGLDLTSEQREQIRSLRQEMRARGRTDDPEARKRRRQEFRSRVQSILTAQQKAKLRAGKAGSRPGSSD